MSMAGGTGGSNNGGGGGAGGDSGPILSNFVYQSDVASNNIQNPLVSLASLLIRISFGPSVQLVSDCLQCRGTMPLKQLMFYLQQDKKRKLMTTITITKAQIRASLLVLIQHSIVTMKRQPVVGKKSNNPGQGLSSSSSSVLQTFYSYQYDVALQIVRYPRYVEYMKKALDTTAACLIEELIINGRLRTIDLIVKTAEVAPKSEKYTTRQTVIEAFCKLVNTGFVEQITPLPTTIINPDDGETEMDDTTNKNKKKSSDSEPAKKKVKLYIPDDDDNNNNDVQQQQQQDLYKDEDPAVVVILKSQHHYKTTLPVDAVWRINTSMFHETFRAFAFGKLIAERHGHKVPLVGSLVTAALRYRSHLKHGAKTKIDAAVAAIGYSADMTVFSTDDIIKYIPKPVLQILEKKVGGLAANLSRSWQELSERTNPEVVRRIGENRYEITIGSINKYMQDRTIQQIVLDRHGQIASRCVNILLNKGWLEAETLAESAMIPVKDTREVLHQLYRSGYIDLFHISNSRTYNPSKAIFLWCCSRQRIFEKIIQNVSFALLQIKLRYEHECDIGKQWIVRERARCSTQDDNDATTSAAAATAAAITPDAIEENDLESDKVNYQRFTLGLERLDVATQQLDETLMALRDF